MRNKNLRVYAVAGKLENQFTTKKDVRNGIERLPTPEFLTSDEDDFLPILQRDESVRINITLELSLDEETQILKKCSSDNRA